MTYFPFNIFNAGLFILLLRGIVCFIKVKALNTSSSHCFYFPSSTSARDFAFQKTTTDCVQLLILHMRGENKSDSEIRDIFRSIENCTELWSIHTIVAVNKYLCLSPGLLNDGNKWWICKEALKEKDKT